MVVAIMEPETLSRKRKLFTTEAQVPDKGAIPDLPLNAKINVTHRSFTAEQINDIDPAERSMIMQIVTYCCHTIAKKHRQVVVTVSESTASVCDIPFKCFSVHAKFPTDVIYKKTDWDRIQQINATFIRDIRGIREADGNALDMNVFSTKNKFAIKDIIITHIHQEHVVINTYENDIEDGRGGAKRPRSSSTSSS